MSPRDFNLLIARTLRWGVTLACLIAAIGGSIYLWQHGSDPLPDYTRFSATEAAQQSDYTTMSGILSGLWALQANSWVQLGVCVLILTPIVRVFFSLLEYVHERDWIYAGITSLVLSIILGNSLGGF